MTTRQLPSRLAAARVEKLLDISRRLSAEVSRIEVTGKVEVIYNPLDYAWPSHKAYIEKFGGVSGRILLLGMNPGPWGMAQTGVPFGEIASVRDWMGIEADIAKPRKEHPKRKIDGWQCTRSEVSGKRLWGWARERFGTPDKFFRSFYVYNYCPLSFMAESGANITPDKLAKSERDAIYAVCDRALRENCAVLEPTMILGVGGFGAKRAEKATDGIAVGQILHPSPASPIANRGWAPQAEAQLRALGIDLPN